MRKACFPRLIVGILFLTCRTAPLTAQETAPHEVVIDFEQADLTGRWIESWEDQGVRFTPAHQPTKSKARARIMFFPHLATGHKGILSAMADDPIPVRATFPKGASSVTVVFWGSTGCAARLEAFDATGKLLDEASVEQLPGRQAPGDAIPMIPLTVKATNIAYVQFSGPRVGEYLAADEVRFTPNSTKAE